MKSVYHISALMAAVGSFFSGNPEVAREMLQFAILLVIAGNTSGK